jgi:hypothetical protein
MQFKMTVTWQNGTHTASWNDADEMREELERLAGVLDGILPGESITIERIS